MMAAIISGDEALVKELIEKGSSINEKNMSDKVEFDGDTFYFDVSPLEFAFSHKQYKIVKLLVDYGADVTITDNYGVRPYTVAKRNRNMEMAEFIKSLEPEELHSEAAHAKLLSSYNMPLEMEEYLKNGNLYLEFPDDSHIEWIKLNEYTDVCEMTFKKKKVLSIVENSSDGDIILVWEPKTQSIYFVDFESNSMRKVGLWETFIKNPIKCLNRVIVWAKPL